MTLGWSGMRRRSAALLVVAFTTFSVVAIVRVQGQAASGRAPAGTAAAPKGSTPAARQAPAAPAVVRTAARVPAAPDAATIAKRKALLDQYCVTCHNDRL